MAHTLVQIEKKIAELRKNFGRKRFSSTGSVKITYSESSNTSMEDISRHWHWHSSPQAAILYITEHAQNTYFITMNIASTQLPMLFLCPSHT